MPTLREELEPLRRFVKGGGLPTLKAMIEFIDKADKALFNGKAELCTCNWDGYADGEDHAYDCKAKWAYELRALLDQQIE